MYKTNEDWEWVLCFYDKYETITHRNICSFLGFFPFQNACLLDALYVEEWRQKQISSMMISLVSLFWDRKRERKKEQAQDKQSQIMFWCMLKGGLDKLFVL
jgi:hypothetical protein